MKKLLIILAFVVLLAPTVSQAVTVPLDRFISGAQRLLYSTDSLLIGASATTTTSKLEVFGTTTAQVFTATSTTATSTFAGKLQLTKTGNSPQLVGWDDDTGIHFDGPDILSFHTGAVQRVLINALGYMGIGTSSPYKQLSITGDMVGTNLFATSTINVGTSTSALHSAGAQFKGNLEASNAGSELSLATASDGSGRSGLSLIRSRGTINSPTAVSLNDSLGFFGFKGYDGVSAAQLPALVEAFVDGTVSSGVVPARLSFVTGSNGTTRRERLTIKNDGKIGIGTTSPYTALAVAGTIVSDNTVATSTTATSTFAGPVGVNGYFYTGPYLYDGTYPNFDGQYSPDNYIADFTKDVDDYAAVNCNNLNAGVNASCDLVFNNNLTSDPESDGEFSYYGDIGFTSSNYNVPFFGLQNVANMLYMYNKDGPLSFATATSSTRGYIQFITGGFSAEAARITSTGAFGIGTTSPSARLAVTNPLSTATVWFEDQANDASPFVIDSAGSVGIGTSSPLAKLDLADGNIRFSAVNAPSGVGPVGTAGAAGVLTGTYRYRTSFVTATGETVLGSLSSASVTVSGQQINVTGIEVSTDARVTSRKLYRNKTADGVFAGYYLVATIANNTATTYTDNTADASLGALNSAIPTVGGVIYKNTNVLMNINETQTSAGYNSLRFSGGQANTAYGLGTMQSNTTGSFSNAFGSYALASQSTAVANNAFGASALALVTTGGSNSAFGNNAGASVTTGTGNVFFGSGTGQNPQTGIDNTLVGAGAGTGVASNSFSNNTLIGRTAGTALSTGSNNLMLGYRVGDACVTCTGNILIGYDIDATSTTATNSLNIGNTIFGTNINSTGTTVDTDAKIGIGSTTPFGYLDVNTSTTGRYSSLSINGTAMGLFRYDDNAASNAIILENRDIAATTDHGTRILARFSDNSTSAPISAGDIRFMKERQWTTTTSTQDSKISFRTATDAGLIERMVIASNAVGIGTSTPKSSSLSIVGSSLATYGNFSVFTSSGATTDAAFSFFSDSDPETQTMTVLRGASNGGLMGIGTSTPWGKLVITNLGTTVPSFVVEDSASPDTTPFLIDPSGNVGIGTSTPSGKLHITFDNSATTAGVIVAPSSASNRTLHIDGNVMNARLTNQNIVSTAAHIALQSDSGAGNVGVGSTTPFSKLSVTGTGTGSGRAFSVTNSTNVDRFFVQDNGNVVIQGSTNAPTATRQLNVFESSGAPQIRFGNSDSFYWEMGRENVSTGRFQLLSGASEYLSILSTGNVGIGTTTPQAKLHVSSGASATTTISVGELNLSSSKACVNMQTSAGTRASFYINAAGVMVTELNACR